MKFYFFGLFSLVLADCPSLTDTKLKPNSFIHTEECKNGPWPVGMTCKISCDYGYEMADGRDQNLHRLSCKQGSVAVRWGGGKYECTKTTCYSGYRIKTSYRKRQTFSPGNFRSQLAFSISRIVNGNKFLNLPTNGWTIRLELINPISTGHFYGDACENWNVNADGTQISFTSASWNGDLTEDGLTSISMNLFFKEKLTSVACITDGGAIGFADGSVWDPETTDIPVKSSGFLGLGQGENSVDSTQPPVTCPVCPTCTTTTPATTTEPVTTTDPATTTDPTTTIVPETTTEPVTTTEPTTSEPTTEPVTTTEPITSTESTTTVATTTSAITDFNFIEQGYVCFDISPSSVSFFNGWTNGMQWTGQATLTYDIPTSYENHRWYLVATFSYTLYGMEWWEHELQENPVHLSQGITWKLKPSENWHTADTALNFNFHTISQNNVNMSPDVTRLVFCSQSTVQPTTAITTTEIPVTTTEVTTTESTATTDSPVVTTADPNASCSTCMAGNFQYNIIYHDWKISAQGVCHDIKHMIDNKFNVIILAFLVRETPYDAYKKWIELSPSARQDCLDYANARGAKIIMSVGGATDHIENYLHLPGEGTKYGTHAAQKAKEYGFHGLDFDFELSPGNKGPWDNGDMVKWLEDTHNAARAVLPVGEYLLGHAPMSAYVGSWADNKYGTFLASHINEIDFFSVQYYNAGWRHNTYEKLFISNEFIGSSVTGLINQGIPVEKIVIGKPQPNTYLWMAGDGYVEPGLLNQWACRAENEGIGRVGGFMTWMYNAEHPDLAEVWAAALTTACNHEVYPANQCGQVQVCDGQTTAPPTTQVVTTQDPVTSTVLSTTSSSETSEYTESGYSCFSAPVSIVSYYGGWGSWTFQASFDYTIPTEASSKPWYLVVEFSYALSHIEWWEHEFQQQPNSVNGDSKIWKLKPSTHSGNNWHAADTILDFNIHGHSQNTQSGPPSVSEITYCFEGSGSVDGGTGGDNGGNTGDGTTGTSSGWQNGPNNGEWSGDDTSGVSTSYSAIQQTCNDQSFTQSCTYDRNTLQSWQHNCDFSNQGGHCLSSDPGQTQINFTPSDVTSTNNYDLNEVLHKSILFYEAQVSGPKPDWNRIPWRSDSNLFDGCSAALNSIYDLTGGWFDAGDTVKFHLPLSATATILFTGAIEFSEGYALAGETQNLNNNLRFITDYFIKLHPSENVYIGQVADGDVDHSIFNRPEKFHDMCRPVWICTPEKPCTEPAANTAAALAAASVYFKDIDAGYAQECYEKAVSLMNFANNYRAEYHSTVTDAWNFYRSWSGYFDELALGWAWLAKASPEGSAERQAFLEKSMGVYDTIF